MKRLLSLLLIFAVSLSLVGCIFEKNDDDDGFTPELTDTADMDFSFTKRDESAEYSDSVFEVSDAYSTITSQGTYVFCGEYEGIVVDAEGEKVQIVLDGAKICSESGPAIYVKAAKKVFITLLGDENLLSDGEDYSEIYTSDSIDACVFSRADMTVNGNGSLTVIGKYKHAVVSKDDLIIVNASLTVTSVGSGLVGKDRFKAKNADITVTSGTDSIKSTNDSNSAKGFVYIENCKLNLSSGRDSIQAETILKIVSGEISVKSGIGASDYSESYKGLKSAGDVLIDGGNFTLECKDDAVHANGSVIISGGKFEISTKDDGIHADSDVQISGGEINIAKSYEGIEGARISISGGAIYAVASDDGINAASGRDGGSGLFGQDRFNSSTGEIVISGGYIFVNARGDGIDSNGDLTVSGGTVLISGPTDNGNGALDYDGDADISGGVLIALGSYGMMQSIKSDGESGVISCYFNSISADTAITVTDDSGAVIVGFAPPKAYNSAVIVAPDIKVGESYNIYYGGTLDGADENGYASGGTLTGGTLMGTISASEGYSGGGMGMGGGGHGGGGQGGRPGGR